MRPLPLLIVLVVSTSCVAAPTLLKLAPTSLTKDELARHVLNRAAFGPSPADVALVKSVGAERWLSDQLASGSDQAFEAQLAARYPTLGLSIGQAYEQYPPLQKVAKQMGITKESLATDEGKGALKAMVVEKLGHPVELPRQLVLELTEARLQRAVGSKRQLEEVLVDFWFNHFNVSAEKGRVKWMVGPFERDAIRPFVFGKFADLLHATARHPAMLFYLDNWLSVRDGMVVPKALRGEGFGKKGNQLGLNENYARELLELHTLGVKAGYTQGDVREAARALSGWSLVAKESKADFGEFIYRPYAHDDGAKDIFGLHLKAGGGQSDGDQLLDYLALHPQTAHHLAQKLCEKFVADEPPAAMVDRVAAEYLRTGGDLRATYVAIFSSAEFVSPKVVASKTKTPLEFVASSVRAVGTLGSEPLLPLVRAMDSLGQPLYRAQPPTGYAEAGSAWVNAGALVGRINFGMRLAANRVKGVEVPLSAPLKPTDADAVIDQMAGEVLGHRPSPATRATLKRALQPSDDAQVEDGEKKPIDARFVAGLLLGSPEFQKQ